MVRFGLLAVITVAVLVQQGMFWIFYLKTAKKAYNCLSILAFALKCYNCTSLLHPECGDPFQRDKIDEKLYSECVATKNFGPSYCVKAKGNLSIH